MGFNESMKRIREINEKRKQEELKLDNALDKLINKSIHPSRIDEESEIEEDEWHFEHDDMDCPKCSKGKESHSLNFYLGTHKGEDAQKYECSNCGYIDIKTIAELMDEQD